MKLMRAGILILFFYLAIKLGIPAIGYFFYEGIWPIVPTSLMKMYMGFVIVGVFLYLTSNEGYTRELVEPIKEIYGNPEKVKLRMAVITAIALVGGYITYQNVKPSIDAPVEVRAIHPAPPSYFGKIYYRLTKGDEESLPQEKEEVAEEEEEVSMPRDAKMYGEYYNLFTIANPFRKDRTDFEKNVREGGIIYFKNCFFCHGDKLNGKGHYYVGFFPRPANFAYRGAIAQFEESFVFWRVVTGGPGLPKEGAPWSSAMPVWQDFLTEDEIWKVILFLYDYTGYSPKMVG